MALENWYIGVLAAVSALIVILVVIIIVLCFLWCRKRKPRGKNDHQNHVQFPGQRGRTSAQLTTVDSTQDSSPENPNWILFQGGATSAPASTNITRTPPTGVERSVAGTSMVKLSDQLDHSTAHGNRPSLSSQKFGVSDYRKWGAETNEERMTRLGHIPPRSKQPQDSTVTNIPPYVKPKVQVSAKLYPTSTTYVKEVYYTPETTRTARPALETQATHRSSGRRQNLAYVIPDVDYDGRPQSSGLSLYNTQQGRVIRVPDGKVKNLAAGFEEPTSPDRHAPQATPQRYPAEYPGMYSDRMGSNASRAIPGDSKSPFVWKPKSAGTNTIEHRVNKMKKLGAVSVFPD